MPLPPYHLGPGLAFKAIGGRHFSLISFTLSQVLIDLEPLLAYLAGRQSCGLGDDSPGSPGALVSRQSHRLDRPVRAHQ